ncbi:ABC transporter ATP-binding protein [Rhodococcus opacus]|uniref:Putative ABC transporter permease/ATP-binding protein n=1 Tax=Rhodococcus opacus (strain B4) TaxID=632772 RepID=C1BEE7_RHOOB|nr:ABC transporter ATP-binding protein [Rhodococcus opacus]BAH56187.1 putative ABC transporter permease/ATP-binding protein [Rhodococcus opacus B4]
MTSTQQLMPQDCDTIVPASPGGDVRGRRRRLRAAVAPVSAAVTMWRQLVAHLPVPDRRRLLQAVLATAIASLATASIPVIVGMFVDAVYDDGELVGLGQALWPLITLFIAYTLISLMNVVRHQKVHAVTTSFEAGARTKIYGHLIRWPLQRFHTGTDGAIYGRANRSVEGAVRLIKLGSADLLPAVLIAVFAIGIATARHGLLGLLMSVVIPTGFGLVAWQIASQNGIRVSLKNTKERIDGWVTSCLTMLKVIRTSGTESYFDNRVSAEVQDLRRTELRHHIVMSLFDCGKAANEVLWLVVTVVVAIQFDLADTPGDLASVILLYAALTRPLNELHRVIDESSEAALQARDLLDDLAGPIDPSFKRADVSPAPDTDEDHGLRRRTGSGTPVADLSHVSAVTLDNVSFSYQQIDDHHVRDDPRDSAASARQILRGVTLRVPLGQRVGLVGASGSGKSTILDLLERLHHHYTGSITINGRDLCSIDRTYMTENIGYVGQRPTLFPGTIRDNLVMGRPGITDTDLDTACLRANIYHDIQRIDGGYEANVAQKGENLSGGQQQRLCIARALLHTPSIMLLDEPTSALDGPSQAIVQRAIDGFDDVTMLVVAHRLSTLSTMDRIVVLHDGQIVEDGTYIDLSASNGPFAAMLKSEPWTSQCNGSL